MRTEAENGGGKGGAERGCGGLSQEEAGLVRMPHEGKPPKMTRAATLFE